MLIQINNRLYKDAMETQICGLLHKPPYKIKKNYRLCTYIFVRERPYQAYSGPG